MLRILIQSFLRGISSLKVLCEMKLTLRYIEAQKVSALGKVMSVILMSVNNERNLQTAKTYEMQAVVTNCEFILTLFVQPYDLPFTEHLQTANSLTVLGCALHAVFEYGRTDILKNLWNVDPPLQIQLEKVSCQSKEASWEVLWQMAKKRKSSAKMIV